MKKDQLQNKLAQVQKRFRLLQTKAKDLKEKDQLIADYQDKIEALQVRFSQLRLLDFKAKKTLVQQISYQRSSLSQAQSTLKQSFKLHPEAINSALARLKTQAQAAKVEKKRLLQEIKSIEQKQKTLEAQHFELLPVPAKKKAKAKKHSFYKDHSR